MKILMAVPTFDVRVDIDCVKSIYNLSKPCEVELDFVTGYDCAKARNDIARKAIKGDFDYVFMVDSDIVLPHNALEKLLANGQSICFGVYPRKYTEEVEVIKIDRPVFWDVFKMDESIGLNDVVEVKACGFGCALIQTTVFSYLKYPYFKYETFEDGSLLSEDYYFCEKARGAGLKIYADFSVKCGHIGRFTKRIKKGG